VLKSSAIIDKEALYERSSGVVVDGVQVRLWTNYYLPVRCRTNEVWIAIGRS